MIHHCVVGERDWVNGAGNGYACPACSSKWTASAVNNVGPGYLCACMGCGHAWCHVEVSEIDRHLASELRHAFNLRQEQCGMQADRPWGTFEVLAEGDGYKVKRLIVNPGQRLSLQRHMHRRELWTIARGVGELPGETSPVHAGDVVAVPTGTIHRLSNPGKIPLEIIEVQLGSYLEEDDVERLEDDYGRIPAKEPAS